MARNPSPTMPQTNPRDFVALLEVFRIGITNKVMDTQWIIEWADAIIEQDAEPDYFIVELAMCGRKNINEMISLLNNYIGEHKPSVAGRATLGFLYWEYTAEKVDVYRVCQTMNWLALHGQFTDEEERLLYAIEDYYSMAVEGVYGSVAAVVKYVRHLLAFYQAFRLDNVAHWDEINAVLEGKIQSLLQELASLAL